MIIVLKVVIFISADIVTDPPPKQEDLCYVRFKSFIPVW
jgi:hypothetical protein